MAGTDTHDSERRELGGSLTCSLDRRESVLGGYERNVLFRTFQTTSMRSTCVAQYAPSYEYGCLPKALLTAFIISGRSLYNLNLAPFTVSAACRYHDYPIAKKIGDPRRMWASTVRGRGTLPAIFFPRCYRLRGPLVGGTTIQVMATSAAKAT